MTVTEGQIEFESMPGQAMYARFCIAAEESNPSIFDRIRYLHVSEMWKELHIVAFTDDEQVVGDLALQQSPEDPGVLWLKHVSVDPDFRKRGIASRLIALCVEHARACGKALEVSSYSQMGEDYLAPLVARLIGDNPDVVIVHKWEPTTAPAMS